jgi:hypothetical protein
MKKLLAILVFLSLLLFVLPGAALGLESEPPEIYGWETPLDEAPEEEEADLPEDSGELTEDPGEEPGEELSEESGEEEPDEELAEELEDAPGEEPGEELAEESEDVPGEEPGEEQAEEEPLVAETSEPTAEDEPTPKKTGLTPFPSLTGNPAEAAFAGTKVELMLLPELTINVGNNLWNLKYADADFTGAAGEAEKKKFLNQIKGTGFLGRFNGDARLGMTIGRFSVHLHPWVSGSFNLGEALPFLVFDGLKADSEYSLSNLGVNSLAAAAVDLNYAFPPLKLKDDTSLAVAMTLRYLRGLGVGHAIIEEGKISTNEYGESSYEIGKAVFLHGMAYNEEEYPGFGGQGIFCDLGAIYRQNRWQAGVAVRNIGSMSWRGVKGQRLSEPLAGEIITGGPEGPVFAFEEEEFEYQAEEFSSYTHSLPLVIEVHGSYQVLRSLAVSGGLEKAMANGWGYSSSPRLWAGVDWRPFRLLRLNGTIARQQAAWEYNTLLQLRLWALWLNLQFSWGGTGFSPEEANRLMINFSTLLHF